MTEREIEAFEKQLKAVPLAPLSDAFFANVAKRLAEESEDTDSSGEANFEGLADVEAVLRRLTPVAPSQAFFEKVEVELADEPPAEIVFPKKRRSGILMQFPRWLSVTATACAAACAVAVGLHFSANEAVETMPNYELVSAEKELCNVEELPIEEWEDGVLVRPVRYIYANTKRWRDPHTQNSFIEYHPFEETVPTMVAVY